MECKYGCGKVMDDPPPEWGPNVTATCEHCIKTKNKMEPRIMDLTHASVLMSIYSQNAMESACNYDSKRKKCYCGGDLEQGTFYHYPHDSGINVPNFNIKQWVSLQCPKCGYHWSLNKLIRFSRLLPAWAK